MPQRQRRRRGPNNSTPGTQGALVTNNLSRGVSQGEVIISRRELLKDLTTANKGEQVLIAPANLPWLKNLAKVFERVRWLSLVIEYRPAVGANTAGTVAIGVDWMSQSANVVHRDGLLVRDLEEVSKSNVLACTPSVDAPVWQRIPSLVVPASRLQSRQWYEVVDSVTSTTNFIDVSPGFVAFYTTAANAGEIWLSYKVHLSGTRA